MGSADTMTASAPEEGRKCWLQVTLDGKIRMVEWNTTQGTFKDLDAKVRRMFGLNDKLKLSYTYKCVLPHKSADIIMSSDEELSAALHFIVGETLEVMLNVERKRKKGYLFRMSRAAKVQCSRVTQSITSLPTSAVACVSTLAGRMRAASQACHARRADAHARENNNHTNTSRRWIVIGVFFLAVLVGSVSNIIRESRNSHFIPPSTGWYNFPPTSSVNILSASYGGRDVTHQAQAYFNKHNNLQASNRVFGDPAVGVPKYLHVVFQRMGPNGIPEVFTQSFGESNTAINLVGSQSPDCPYPENWVIDGHNVKILGALHDGDSVTCEARRLAYNGFDLDSIAHMLSSSHDNRHHSTHKNWFSLAYMKNNKVKLLATKNGKRTN